jgi:hypothetical protein
MPSRYDAVIETEIEGSDLLILLFLIQRREGRRWNISTREHVDIRAVNDLFSPMQQRKDRGTFECITYCRDQESIAEAVSKLFPSMSDNKHFWGKISPCRAFGCCTYSHRNMLHHLEDLACQV